MPDPLPEKLHEGPIPGKALSTSYLGLRAVYFSPWAIWLLLGSRMSQQINSKQVASKKEPILVVFVAPLPSNDILSTTHTGPALYETLGWADLKSGFDPSGIWSLAEAAGLTLFFLNITWAAQGTRTSG